MGMKIGELSARTGCKVVTIRYYEQEGVLTRPARSAGNYRLYDEEDVERLRFVLYCRRHDMNLDEIRNLLSYRDNEQDDCVWVSDLLDTHIAGVDRQIASLKRLKKHLTALRASCDGGGNADSCQIMRGLVKVCACACETHDLVTPPKVTP